MSDRERSASPVREPKAKKQKTSGFKWKESKAKDDNVQRDSRDSGRLERGYRNRSPRRESYRDRDGDDRRDQERKKEPSPLRKSGVSDSYRPDRATDETPKGSESTTNNPVPKPQDASTNLSEKPAKVKKPKQPKPVAPTGPMIVVHINDRLGTKAAIPCLASDNIKSFKALVAAHIGRQPHEIMLKRQGERPFKDQLTLQDYGVSNGVQLDLEIDTGD
ncbi:hypothetical protein LTR62_001427 [Meristemomyces frigidus]|uniref:Ubiquitin-like modifier HUB1 n=1 Tax=Meristemomyces frigidus TaxID=1508187 RepID=A0AAN7TLH1_9PEZI|nr:hypothetical protein LTR62_001427 [Meristemomyces frigidus]